MIISIHALLAESDGREPALSQSSAFLSTLSLRRATAANGFANTPPQISIHALLAESDRLPKKSRPSAVNFYPRSPCGERLAYPDMIICTNVISIHALLAESDQTAYFF